MRRAATPIDILRAQATTIISELPRLRDGHADAIHDARVASRRIRAALPLTGEWYPPDALDDLETTFRRIGKTLGRVRDTDARMALLGYLEARIPPAAPSLLALHRRQERDRLHVVRKLIKQFERSEVTRTLDTIAAGPPRAWWRWTSKGGEWRDDLRRAIGERAAAAREAIDHASGVYFPNRSHAARVALKKLRYALEIACAAGAGRATYESLRYLKNTQDVLGDLHDRHVLVDDLPPTPTRELPEIDSDQIALVRQVLDAESRDLYARFVRRRPHVFQICNRFAPARERRRLPIAPAAAALVVSSAFYFLSRRTRQAELRPLDRDISIRIPIPEAPVHGR